MKTFDEYSTTYSLYSPQYKRIIYCNGIAYVPDFSLYQQYFLQYTIPAHHEYRPDKISMELYSTPYLDWVLNEINYFTHGIKEYKKNTTINYLDVQILRTIGIV